MKFTKKNGGFTLVELIVVIAILAILAAIAVPAYSGYIKKAKEAADQTLLGAVNTAFAAACLEDGVDAISLKDRSVAFDMDNMTVKGKYSEAFDRYFAANAGSEFKVIKRLELVGGIFVNPANHVSFTNGAYNGSLVSVSKNDINALAGSTYWTNASLGAEGLTNKLGEVTEFAAGFAEGGSDAFTAVLESEDFQTALFGYMGVTSEEELNAKFEAMEDEEAASLMANATVLFAAENAQNMSQEEIDAIFKDGAKDVILGNVKNNNTTTAMSQAALAYGMYTAWAYSTNDADKIASTSDPLAIMNALDDDAFQAYMASDAGKADLEGYLAGMSMITDGAKDSTVAGDILTNGFADNQELVDLLNSLTGTN